MFVLFGVAVAALCCAGIYRGEQRMLRRLNRVLVEAKVIEDSDRSPRQQPNQKSRRTVHRTKGIQLEAVLEEPPRAPAVAKPPAPTRTYSLRFTQPRPSLARRMSAALFGGKPLIDLNSEIEAPIPLREFEEPQQLNEPRQPGEPQQLGEPLKPQEEGDWV